MDKNDLIKLTNRVTAALESLDINLWDANVFVYNNTPVSDTEIDIDDLYARVCDGTLSAFIEVDAILGDKVWDLIETFNG